MAERVLSKRSKRRLRLDVAKRLAGPQSPAAVCESTDPVESDDPSFLRKRRKRQPSLIMDDTTAIDLEAEASIANEVAGYSASNDETCLSIDPGCELEVAGYSSSSSENAAHEVDIGVGLCSSEIEMAGYSSSSSESDTCEVEAGVGLFMDPGYEEELVGYSCSDGTESEFEIESDEDGICLHSESEFPSDIDLSSDERPSASAPSQQQRSDPFLFAGSNIRSNDFDVSFMALSERHHLTYACQEDILKLMSYTIPHPNRVPSSAYALRTKFIRFKKETSVYHFCGDCLHPLTVGSTCSNTDCSQRVQHPAIFIQVPLASQLQERFKGT